jgi:hypothetical protein
MACARRRIRPIDRLVAAHITKIGLKSLFFSGLLGRLSDRRLRNQVNGMATNLADFCPAAQPPAH